MLHMNIGNRRARNALCFMQNVRNKSKKGLPLETKNTKSHENRRLSKTQAIPLTFWYRILVPDFPSWSRQIQIDLPH